MGSTGASTPLHFDSYGYNLVAQVSALPVGPISEHSGALTHAHTRAHALSAPAHILVSSSHIAFAARAGGCIRPTGARAGIRWAATRAKWDRSTTAGAAKWDRSGAKWDRSTTAGAAKWDRSGAKWDRSTTAGAAKWDEAVGALPAVGHAGVVRDSAAVRGIKHLLSDRPPGGGGASGSGASGSGASGSGVKWERR